MTNELFQDQMDLYLAGTMPATARAEFEANIAGDPLLKGELDLQRDITEALARNRKAALKQRLQNIDVSGIPAEPTFSYKTLAGVSAAAGVAAIAAIMLLNPGSHSITGNSTGASQAVTTQGTTASNPEQTGSQNSSTSTGASVLNQEQAQNNAVESTPGTNSAVTSSSSSLNQTTASASKAGSQVNGSANKATHRNKVAPPVFGNDEEADQASEIKRGDADLVKPENKAGGQISEGLVGDIEVVKNNSKYTNHYQYFNNKLFLYGDFDKNLYELLEFNSAKGKKLYIFHNNEFSQVQSGTTEITKLSPITDPQLVQDLNNQKKKKSE